MPQSPPTLHLLCGKIAAGKSTLAANLAAQPGAILIAEDLWLGGLFGAEMKSAKDFIIYSTRLRETLGPHIVSLLRNDLSVVLDFQANTVESRVWMRGLIDAAGCAHALHVLLPPDEVCLARLKARNASGTHPFTVSEEQFHRVSAYFVAPTPEEGFNLVVHDQAA